MYVCSQLVCMHSSSEYACTPTCTYVVRVCMHSNMYVCSQLVCMHSNMYVCSQLVCMHSNMYVCSQLVCMHSNMYVCSKLVCMHSNMYVCSKLVCMHSNMYVCSKLVCMHSSSEYACTYSACLHGLQQRVCEPPQAIGRRRVKLHRPFILWCLQEITHVHNYFIRMLMRDEEGKEERSKQGHTNNKATCMCA